MNSENSDTSTVPLLTDHVASRGNVHNGHRPSIERLRIDLHHIICIFLASRPLAELVSREPEYAARDLVVHELENTEISRLLLSTAITLRVLDDRENGDLDCLSLHCGTLIENAEQASVSEGLTIRKACNKIIHATNVHYERLSELSACQYLGPSFRLAGAHRNGTTWIATINAYEFAREGLRAIHDL